MKKLVLKKIVIANLDADQMNVLKGGTAGGTATFYCESWPGNYCPPTSKGGCTDICKTAYDGGKATECAPCL